MLSRFTLIASVLALSLAACAPAEPPLLIDDTSSASVAGDDLPPRINEDSDSVSR